MFRSIFSAVPSSPKLLTASFILTLLNLLDAVAAKKHDADYEANDLMCALGVFIAAGAALALVYKTDIANTARQFQL